jgi:hypothetical protein
VVAQNPPNAPPQSRLAIPPMPTPSLATETVITVSKDGPILGDQVLTADRLDARLTELAAATPKLPVMVIPGDHDIEPKAVDDVKARAVAKGLELTAKPAAAPIPQATDAKG